MAKIQDPLHSLGDALENVEVPQAAQDAICRVRLSAGPQKKKKTMDELMMKLANSMATVNTPKSRLRVILSKSYPAEKEPFIETAVKPMADELDKALKTYEFYLDNPGM